VGYSDNTPPPEINRNGSVSGLSELEEIMRNAIDNPDTCVFLHPGQRRDYTRDELIALRKRDFETRLFLTSTQCAGDTVFLRTHHTDNAGHESHLNYVRDYLKAAHATRITCAKSNLTTLLTMCFELAPSDYYTFAISLASGLSNYGQNTDFEINTSMAPSQADVPDLRYKFCQLMDVIFSKMATKKFLLDDKRSNIYRLVYCKTQYSRSSSSIYSAIFSFTLQLCLTAYIGLQQNTQDAEDEGSPKSKCNLSMLALAIFTFTYSFMVAMSTISEALSAYKILFKGVGALMIMDFIANIVLPLLLACYGFFLILSEENFINAVLNTTALISISEIDDQLPQILGYSEDDIIRNFLINESMTDFDAVKDVQVKDLARLDVGACGLPFGDFYITNMQERGMIAQRGHAFQPYQVTQIEGKGVQVDPSTTVTPDCLLRKIEWKYTTGFPKSSLPRVGCLTLTKANGQKVSITRKRDPTGVIGISPLVNTLEGLFIMTTFQMSEDIIKLRVCGSADERNFMKAFDYYSLWHVTLEARRDINLLARRREEDLRRGEENVRRGEENLHEE